jgi:hypothetical protein
MQVSTVVTEGSFEGTTSSIDCGVEWDDDGWLAMKDHKCVHARIVVFVMIHVSIFIWTASTLPSTRSTFVVLE